MLIKLSIGGQKDRLDISQFTGNPSGDLGDCRFSVNDPNVTKADAWFVIEGANPNDLRCEIPLGQFHFLSAETSWNPNRYLTGARVSFLAQFDRVHTFYKTRHKNSNFQAPFLPWMINANHGSIFTPHTRDIRFFENLEALPKEKKLSMFCSDIQWRPVHQKRFQFAEEVKRVFGQDVDWFGNGINPIAEKWDGIAPFERTIVLENNSRRGVFSEKIIDAYLGLSVPIYSGDSLIHRKFPVERAELINLDSPVQSIKKLERLLQTPLDERDFRRLQKGKAKALAEFHFLKRICRLALQNNHAGENAAFSLAKLNPEDSFVSEGN